MKQFIKICLAFIASLPLSVLKIKQFPGLTASEINNFTISFSQLGEDIIINNLLNSKRENKGIYVDVGAYHPIMLSNTHLLYKKGWHGINIDLERQKIARFNKFRKRDINLVRAVSDQKKSVKYLKYHTPATDRIVDKNENELKSLLGEDPESIEQIDTQTLTEILDEHLGEGQSIDYLNIDAEGADFQVLQGLNFEKYSPQIISIEAHGQKEQSIINDYLKQKGYTLNSYSIITAIYQKND